MVVGNLGHSNRLAKPPSSVISYSTLLKLISGLSDFGFSVTPHDLVLKEKKWIGESEYREIGEKRGKTCSANDAQGLSRSLFWEPTHSSTYEPP